ncbi:MsnO8 family LLM class oxidoreductase [Bosea sp. CS1GBMeth4]|uniref:MsnO8 family LLM class oxidoreductase n=1 Tax=Bosea sp. CS1GBMeth4 TaxID=1892849 RepID=UPI001645783A|nr:MsnO8 family LLM class oxidoreductase [Bosea sp. CS1GBMeth4]
MTYALSLLDKSPIADGSNPEQALADSVAYARHAERLGYHRFWLAEHHGSCEVAGVAPEVLAAWILASTDRIRVGSGGVMLQHYSPFKVAESFKLLAALAPDRVDLGIGRAPGGLPLATQALQSRLDRSVPPDFTALVEALDGYLSDDLARPLARVAPRRILLGGSPESGALAARLGWEFVFAGHFNGDAALIDASLGAYRAGGGTRAALAVHAFAASSSAAAREAVRETRIFRVTLSDGRAVNVRSREQAESFAHQAGDTNFTVRETHPHVIAGTGEDVRAELDALAVRFGVNEFVLDNPVADAAARRNSIELIAAGARRAAA